MLPWQKRFTPIILLPRTCVCLSIYVNALSTGTDQLCTAINLYGSMHIKIDLEKNSSCDIINAINDFLSTLWKRTRTSGRWIEKSYFPLRTVRFFHLPYPQLSLSIHKWWQTSIYIIVTTIILRAKRKIFVVSAVMLNLYFSTMQVHRHVIIEEMKRLVIKSTFSSLLSTCTDIGCS